MLKQNLLYSFLALLSLTIVSNHTYAQLSCQNPTFLCNNGVGTIDGSLNLPGVLSNPANPDNNYGCHTGFDNARWMFFNTEQSGDVEMQIRYYDDQEIKYAIWGPFYDFSEAYFSCGQLDTPTYCGTEDTILLEALTGNRLYLIAVDFDTINLHPNFGLRILQGYDVLARCILGSSFFTDPCGVATDEPPGCTMCGPVYSGNTFGYQPGTIPEGFCGTVENSQWLTFQAQSTFSQVNITSFDCQMGLGVQMIITDQGLNPVSSCFSSDGNNIPGIITASNLVPGEFYFIMVDGFAGDYCNIIINIPGGINYGPLDPPGDIIATPNEFPICIGETICYKVPLVQNATDYNWVIPSNGTIVTQNGYGNEICVLYNEAGGGAICVTATNLCYPGGYSCAAVLVEDAVRVLLPPEAICAKDFPIVRDGHTFAGPGLFDIISTSSDGCDSISTYEFLSKVTYPNYFRDTLCFGECVLINNQDVCEDGTEIIIPGGAADGCDSSIQVSLTFVGNEVDILNTGSSLLLDCSPGSILTLVAESATNLGTYSWTTTTGNIVSGADTRIAIVNTPGTYVVHYTEQTTAGLTCTLSDEVTVVMKSINYDNPVFSFVPQDICIDIPVTVSINPVINAVDYNWVFPANVVVLNENGTEVDLLWLDGVTSEVCVTAAGNCGQSAEECITLTAIPGPMAIIGGDTEACVGEPIFIGFAGPPDPTQIYTWNFDGGTPTTASGFGPYSVVWNTAGTKDIELTIENQCGMDASTQSIEINAQSSIEADIYTPIWWTNQYGDIDLSVSGGQPDYQITWSNGLSTEDLYQIIPGTYCVTVSDDLGCSTEDCYDIGQGIFRINPIHILCEGEGKTISVRPNHGADFSWLPSSGLSCLDCADPIVSPRTTTQYHVTATLPNGRSATTQVWVIVLPRILCANQPRLAEKLEHGEMSFEQVEKLVLNQFITYPNPVKDELSIYSLSPIQDITLFDLTGKRLETNLNINESEAKVDLQEMSSGPIFIKVKTLSGVNVERIIKE